MRKIQLGFFVTAICLIAISCSNFALPERMHVKAGINPNIPINSEEFNFSKKFQEQLDKVFTENSRDLKTIKVFDYTGDGDNKTQKFLIAFPLQEQSLDFKQYLSEDLELNSKFKTLKQTFKLEELSKDEAVNLDMSSAKEDILRNINFAPPPIPIIPGSYSQSQNLTIPATGFTSLSFYDGTIKVTFSMPASASVTFSSLKINSISASGQPSTASNGSTKTVTASFPLKNQTLTSPLTLSFSYSASGASSGSLSTKIEFSNPQIKTAKGVSFNSVNGDLENETINLNLPPEFIQGVISQGAIILDTSAASGINIDLGGLTIKQDNITTRGHETGLTVSGLKAGNNDIAGKKLNKNQIKVQGRYSVPAQRDTEITFNMRGELEIPVAFAIEKFSTVYINGETIIKNFNDGEDSTIEISLAGLSKTVKSIEIQEAGVDLTFGNSALKGLSLAVESDEFKVKHTEPIEEGKKRFTNKTSNKDSPFPFDVAGNPKATFELTLSSSSGTDQILELTNITPGEEVTIIDCNSEVVFEWEKAVIDPKSAPASGGGNDFTQGTFPEEGEPFSLSEGDLADILKEFSFEGINGYVFFNGPKVDQKITLTLTAFPNAQNPRQLWDEKNKITLGQTPLKLPKDGDPFTVDIEDTDNSEGINGPIEFDETFNRMLGGEGLQIAYNMDIPEITITKEMVSGDDGAKVFKADLVIIVPLKLKPAKDVATIDATKYLGGMTNKNLLSFAENTGGSMQMSFTTLKLNINLSGAPMEKGKVIIERDAVKDKAAGLSIPPVFLNGGSININLADYMGDNQSFTLTGVKLQIEKGGYLQVPRGLSLLSLSVNAGVDVTYDL
jgi:hypothetical protein